MIDTLHQCIINLPFIILCNFLKNGTNREKRLPHTHTSLSGTLTHIIYILFIIAFSNLSTTSMLFFLRVLQLLLRHTETF